MGRYEFDSLVEASDKNKAKVANTLSENTIKNELALAAANNAASAQRQTSVNDTSIKTTQMGNDTTLAVNKPLNDGQVLKNAVYTKTGMAEAENTLADNQLKFNLNKQFGAKEKQSALDMQQATVADALSDIKDRSDGKRLAKLNTSNSVAVQSDVTEMGARNSTYEAQKRNKEALNFDPLAWNSSSGDARSYEDSARETYGLKPANLLDKGMRLLPGVSAERAYKLRNQLRKNADLQPLAKP